MDSDILRWILLVIGIAGIAVIWLSASSRVRGRPPQALREEEPVLGDEEIIVSDDEDELPAVEIGWEPEEPLPVDDGDGDDGQVVIKASRGGKRGARTPPPEKEEPEMGNLRGEDGGEAGGEARGEEKIVVLYVTARAKAGIPGPDLIAAFADNGLEHGEMEIYHRHDAGSTVFSVVNMVNPGTFDPASMEEFSTPGISLFTVLPQGDDSVAAFDTMLDCAMKLAGQLDATVLDETRSAVTRQGCEHTREQIRTFELKLRRPHGRR